MRPLALVLTPLVLAVVLAGCAQPQSQVAPLGCSERSSLPRNVGLPPTEAVTFATGDGVDLHGELWAISTVRYVVLAHGLNEDRHAWDGFVKELIHQQGWSVLAFDLRGHGQSTMRGNATYELRNFTAHDILAMQRDVEAAVEVVRGRADPGGAAPACIVLGGASIGANLALRVAAGKAEHVDAVAMLSPGQDYRGIRADDVIGAWKDRPLFLAAARGDTYAGQSAQALAAQASKEDLALVEGEAHGTELLAGQVQPRLLAWFDGLR